MGGRVTVKGKDGAVQVGKVKQNGVMWEGDVKGVLEEEGELGGCSEVKERR